MKKFIKTVISEVQQPLSQGEKAFKDLHGPLVIANRNMVPGVTDQDFLFKGRDRAMDPRTASYEDEESQINAYDKGMKIKEDSIIEKHLTPREKAKKEAIVKALKRSGMSPEKAYPIATATAKRVTEGSSKPDFLDMDKDGDKKEPMKKAIKDKQKVAEELKGNQHRIDANNNKEIDAEDFRLLKKKKKAMKEDADFDYEGQMSKAELNAIADKAAVIADMLDNDSQMEAWLQSKISRAKDYIDAVHDYMMYTDHDKEEQEEQMGTYAQSPAMASNYANFINRMGEEIEIDEARRGRPSKNASGEEEGGREHIIVQLRKAENLRGSEKPVEFNDNSRHVLNPTHVKKALDMHLNMKPIEKGEFESRIAKSHDSFISAIRGEPPEKAKPRITLGSMRRESAEIDEARGSVKASDRRERIAVTTTNPTTGEPIVKWMSLPKKDIKVTENITNVLESLKANMQQDSLNRLNKMSPQASNMKIKLPPTQGNKPVGGDEQVHASMAEEMLNRLYKSLSEDNQTRFLQKLDTEDGTEELIQFAQEQGF